jgi:hypothetical protein
MLKQLLNNLSKDLRRRVYEVKDLEKESLKELKEQLKYFDEYSDFSFNADSNSIYLIYNYQDPIDADYHTEVVTLPDLFIEDFEKFMKN